MTRRRCDSSVLDDVEMLDEQFTACTNIVEEAVGSSAGIARSVPQKTFSGIVSFNRFRPDPQILRLESNRLSILTVIVSNSRAKDIPRTSQKRV